MLVVGMAVAMASAQAAEPAPLVQFVRGRSLIYTTEKIEVYEGGWNKEAGRSEYQVHFSWSWFQPDGDLKGGAWLDSRSCPAIRSVLESLESLDMPKPQPWKRSPPHDGWHLLFAGSADPLSGGEGDHHLERIFSPRDMGGQVYGCPYGVRSRSGPDTVRPALATEGASASLATCWPPVLSPASAVPPRS